MFRGGYIQPDEAWFGGAFAISNQTIDLEGKKMDSCVWTLRDDVADTVKF